VVGASWLGASAVGASSLGASVVGVSWLGSSFVESVGSRVNGEAGTGACGIVCASSMMPIIVAAIAVDKEIRTIFLLLLKLTFPDNSVLQLLDKWLWMNSLDMFSC